MRPNLDQSHGFRASAFNIGNLNEIKLHVSK